MKPVITKDKLDKRQKSYLKKKFGINKIWDVVVCVIISVLCDKKDWEEIHDFVGICSKF